MLIAKFWWKMAAYNLTRYVCNFVRFEAMGQFLKSKSKKIIDKSIQNQRTLL